MRELCVVSPFSSGDFLFLWGWEQEFSEWCIGGNNPRNQTSVWDRGLFSLVWQLSIEGKILQIKQLMQCGGVISEIRMTEQLRKADLASR